MKFRITEYEVSKENEFCYEESEFRVILKSTIILSKFNFRVKCFLLPSTFVMICSKPKFKVMISNVIKLKVASRLRIIISHEDDFHQVQIHSNHISG